MTELCEGYAGIRATPKDSKYTVKVEVEARCVECGFTWWIGPGEAVLPVCYQCGTCGIATKRDRATIGGTP